MPVYSLYLLRPSQSRQRTVKQVDVPENGPVFDRSKKFLQPQSLGCIINQIH